MYTSDNRAVKRQLGRAGFAYLLVSLLCALFSAVYEYFSHGVYSNYMVYAFAFPLAGGALPFFTLALFGARRLPGRAARNLYNAGIATLTLGSLMQGALDIYGTTNSLTDIYWYAGLALAAAGLLAFGLGASISARPAANR